MLITTWCHQGHAARGPRLHAARARRSAHDEAATAALKAKSRAWRRFLADEVFGATAVVRSDPAGRQIQIYVNGIQPRDFLTVLRSILLEIHRTFEHLDYKEKVPLPDNPELAVSYDHLIQLESVGQAEYFPDGAEHPYLVSDLVGSVYFEAKRTEEQFIEILQRIVSESDNEDSALSKANNILMLQPNFMGLGVNLNALVKLAMRKWSQR